MWKWLFHRVFILPKYQKYTIWSYVYISVVDHGNYHRSRPASRGKVHFQGGDRLPPAPPKKPYTKLSHYTIYSRWLLLLVIVSTYQYKWFVYQLIVFVELTVFVGIWTQMLKIKRKTHWQTQNMIESLWAPISIHTRSTEFLVLNNVCIGLSLPTFEILKVDLEKLCSFILMLIY